MRRTLFGTLLAIGLADELVGVGPIAAADIEHDLRLTYAQAALALFTLPGLIAMVVEPPLMLLADRKGPRAAMVLGLLAMGAGLMGCSLATGWPLLAALTTIYFVGSGIGVVLAKTALLDAHPDQHAWIMARWTLMGAFGDILGPLALAGLAAASFGWRTGYVLAGGLMVALAVLVAGVRVGSSQPEEEPEQPLSEVLREAFTNKPMLAWLFASSSCDLLDEVFMAFAGLYLVASFQADPEARSLVLAVFMAGGVLGVVALERALAAGVGSRRILKLASIGCAAAFVAWMGAPSLVVSAGLLGVLGFFGAQLWPLTEAEAYDSWPGSARIVEATSGVFGPLALGVPYLVGWIADLRGLGTALVVLLLQPVLVFVVATFAPEPP